MKRLFAVLALVALSITPVRADNPDCAPGSIVLEAFAQEELTVSTTALFLTASTYQPSGQQGAALAFISISGAAARFTLDGTAATTDIGHVLADGDYLKICTTEIRKAQFIRDASTDVELTATYFRTPQ